MHSDVLRDFEKRKSHIYVWQAPVRIFHWINAASIIILMVTGLYIGRPFVSAPIPEEASYNFVMGWIRIVHFVTAFIFTINLFVRWYWVFAGNKYATSNLLKKDFWTGVKETTKYYLFLPNKKQHYVGHNPLAQLSYWIFIGVGSIIVIFTGYYMLFEPQPESSLGQLFSWVPSVFGNSFAIRSWHHLAAWGFMIFMIVHIYMSFREDWLQKNGTLSSIFTGYKYEQEHIEGEKIDKSEKQAN
ncbi:Ni/Fe-hydrogenase, b-type cytochrome subunit [Schinkia sp. CFF1]